MTDESRELKQIARERVEHIHEALIGLSHWIQANPELNYHETLAVGWLVEWLEKAGFSVEKDVAGLETAFVGRYGSGDLHVAIVAEYDALPEVGHACGHNVIAAAAIGAGIALAGVADQLGLRVDVIGTPAEEGGGGKIVMVDAGVFADEHLALMVHPGPSDMLLPEVLAAETIEITYTGRTAHAGSFPERGINAADAMVVAQVALGLLRQQLTAGDRVHGIVTSGGEASNIIPSRTTAEWMIRAQSVARLEEVREKVLRCFEAGALASGAELDVSRRPVYADMRHDPDLTALLPGQSRGARAAVRPARAAGHDTLFDRYGQRLVRGSVDTPDSGHRLRAGGQPPARVHRGHDLAGGRPGDLRRRRGHGLDGDRRSRRPHHSRAPRARFRRLAGHDFSLTDIAD